MWVLNALCPHYNCPLGLLQFSFWYCMRMLTDLLCFENLSYYRATILKDTKSFTPKFLKLKKKIFTHKVSYLYLDIVAPVTAAVCLPPLSTTNGVFVSFCFCCNIVSVPKGVSVELIVFINYK